MKKKFKAWKIWAGKFVERRRQFNADETDSLLVLCEELGFDYANFNELRFKRTKNNASNN